MTNSLYENQKQFWEIAGKVGYDEAVFSSQTVARHVSLSHWNTAIAMAKELGLTADAHVLEVGCGDGHFARTFLAPNYRRVDACDISVAAIERAQAAAQGRDINFFIADATRPSFLPEGRWAAVFLVGFLHHAKPFLDTILEQVCSRTSVIILTEPNGDNPIRKALEWLPSYRRAGEDSFSLAELTRSFARHHFSLTHSELRSLMPSFLPEGLFRPMLTVEKMVEASPFLRQLCSTRILGFRR